MSRRIIHCTGLAAALALLACSMFSCDYSGPQTTSQLDGPPDNPLPRFDPVRQNNRPEGASAAKRSSEDRLAILNSAMTQIQRACLQPGGEDFKLAVQRLNQYFDGTSPSEYQLESAAREYLKTQMPAGVLDELTDRNWILRDTRHIEDCMMYYPIANRIAGNGDNLSRVRRVFAWVVAQAQLVPPGALAFGGLTQAFARPYDVLLRGMATESQGVWAERAWLFIALCRQLEIDAGLITYTHSSTLEPLVPRYGVNLELEASLYGLRRGAKSPIVWVCAAIIDEQAYLFDARVGLEIPGPGGVGVATLDQALADPAILERMNLPGQSPYGTSRASLLGSPTKIGILLESTLGYFSPKMKMLQNELGGEYRTILYRDPAEQREHFAQVLGEHAGEIKLWNLPFEVERRLFTDAQFVASIQQSLSYFRREFPLIFARVKQLRGDLDGAINDYVKLRFRKRAPRIDNKDLPIPDDVQAGLDAYATYYLALALLEKAQRDNKPPEQAELKFRNTLELLPEPGPNQPYYHMLRWGANANLGRIYETTKDIPRAIAYQTQLDPTIQNHGNLLRARELVWQNPFAAPAMTLPAATTPGSNAPAPSRN